MFVHVKVVMKAFINTHLSNVSVCVKGVMDLFNNTHLSDVTLVVEDKAIPAHRHVLATHSHMFDRMWNHSMKEVSSPSYLFFP